VVHRVDVVAVVGVQRVGEFTGIGDEGHGDLALVVVRSASGELGVYSSAVVAAPVLLPPPASKTVPFGSRKVWPPLLASSVVASRDQVFVTGS
jgi:hypothetical protein